MKDLSKLGTFAILLTSSLTIMVGTVIAPSLTVISSHLGFAGNPGWLITLPALGVVLFAPTMGKLIDRKGAYTSICWGLVPYALLGAVGAVLDNQYLLIVDRLLLGAATAAIQASSSSLIAEFFQAEKRMIMMARQGMAIEIGGIVFLSLGGVLGELDWKFPFLIYLVSFLCLILIALYIPHAKADRGQEQLQSKQLPASPSSERLISKEILTFCICSTFAMTLFFVAFIGLPQYLPQAFGYSESLTGYFMAFISLVAVLSASQMPKIAKLLGSINTVSVGFLLFGAGLFLFSISSSNFLLLPAALAMGAGFGFTVPLLNHLTVEHSNSKNRGRNLSYYSIGIFGGQFLATFFGMLPTTHQTIFFISAIVAVIVAITIFYRKNMLKRRSLTHLS